MNRVIWMGVAAFIMAVIIQGWLWQTAMIPDGDLWEERVQFLRHDFETGEYRADFDGYSNHPGMSILLPAAGLSLAGLEEAAALRFVMTILNAVSAAGIVVTTYLIRPRLWWWLVAGATAIAHPLYIHMSPSSAVFGPMIVWLGLLTIWLYEHPRHPRTFLVTLLWGGVAGLAGATRWPETILIAGPFWLLLWTRLRPQAVLLTAIVSAVIFVAANPLLSHHPWQHFQFLFRRSSLLYVSMGTSMRLRDFGLFAPLALASIGWALFWLLQRKARPPLARPLLGAFLLATILLTAAFLPAPAQSLRHFFPLILLWETLFAGWILSFIEELGENAHYPFWKVSTTALLVGGQVFLFLLAAI